MLLPRIAAAVPICCNSSSSASEEMPPLAVKATPGTWAANYEAEQQELKERVARIQAELSKAQEATVNAEKFILCR